MGQLRNSSLVSLLYYHRLFCWLILDKFWLKTYSYYQQVLIKFSIHLHYIKWIVLVTVLTAYIKWEILCINCLDSVLLICICMTHVQTETVVLLLHVLWFVSCCMSSVVLAKLIHRNRRTLQPQYYRTGVVGQVTSTIGKVDEFEPLQDAPIEDVKTIHVLRRWQLWQTLTNHLWKRWTNKYLSRLSRFAN